MISTHIDHLATYQRYQQLVLSIRSFLNSRGYLELDLPMLSPALIPESYVEVFETEYRYFDQRQKLYLTPSPELFIKRLLVEGVGNCYYLGKSFRNSEPASSRHLGEFTMLEWYHVDASYMDLADEVLSLLQHIHQSIHAVTPVHTSVIPSHTSVIPANAGTPQPTFPLTYQGLPIDLSRWEKLSVAQAFEQYASITPEQLFDHDLFKQRCKEKGYQVETSQKSKVKSKNTSPNTPTSDSPTDDFRLTTEDSRPATDDCQLMTDDFPYESLWSQVYATEIEPHLGTHGYPTLIYDYPVEFAALSKPNTDGKTAQRFEFYIAGLELGNCYSELTDWKLQEKRLIDEAALRAASNRISHPSDSGFVDSLRHGLPECAGIAIGVERLAMIFTDTKHITDLKLITVND